MLPCTSPGPSVSALGKAVPYNSSTAFGILHSGVNRTYVRHSDHALRGNKGNWAVCKHGLNKGTQGEE